MNKLEKKQIEFLDKYTFNGTWELNPATGLVDIDGDFNCAYRGLKDFQGIRFGNIRGFFNCSGNNLVSLEGAPQKVGKSFYCYNNQLVSLKGSPQEIGGDFDCSHNKLVSLKGAPQEVGGTFSCANNQLVSLEGAPQNVGYSFDCSNNQLVSLEGAPKKVGKSFYCYNNQLASLEGAPQEVLEDFICDPINPRGCPDNLFDKIYFYNNKKCFSLKGYITMIINGLDPEIYLKKMI